MKSTTSRLYSETKKYLEDWIDRTENVYCKRKRKIAIKTMMKILISLTMDKSSSYSKVFIDDDGCEINFNKSSFTKFRNKIPSDEFRKLYLGYLKVLEKLEIFKADKRIVAIDGSKIQLDTRMIKEGYSKIVHFPQGLLNTVLDTTTGIPLINELTKHKNERQALDDFIEQIPERSVILADRGYFSDYLFCKCIRKGLSPVFRLPISLECVKSLINTNLNETIASLSDNTPMRVIKYVINKNSYYIGTSLDSTIEEIKELYHVRWDIEEFFKLLKVTSNFGKLHSTSENGVKQELYLHMFLVTFEKALTFINRNLLVLTEAQKTRDIKKNFNHNALLHMVKMHTKKICSDEFSHKHTMITISNKLSANIEITKKSRNYPRYIQSYTNKEKYNIQTRRKRRES